MLGSNRVTATEAAWLMMETRDRPIHVATLLIFALPRNAKPDFLARLVAQLRETTEFVDPFNRRLAKRSPWMPFPFWVRDYDPDMEYHVRHLALPHPGGERELGVLIARLHSNPMDMKRPLWEYYVIEGLENDRFAIYFKMHHAIVDGIAGVRMLQRSMSAKAKDIDSPALWSAPVPDAGVESTAPFMLSGARRLADKALSGAINLGPIAKRVALAARASADERDPLTLPFQTPVSILNHRVTSQRRFATQLYDFQRLRRLAKAAECSVNDIVLAICSGALRKFLGELCALPGQSLTAGIPVSLRSNDDDRAGPAVGFIVANLGTNIADVRRRLETIKNSTTRAKGLLSGMSREGIESFSNLMMLPNSILALLQLEGRVRPVFNVTVSNVPGPAEPLYFRGARLEAMYPVSAVTHGQALNITCYSYAGTFSFGFAGCRDTLPKMQRLAVYSGEALEELEAALIEADSVQAKRTRRTSPKRRAASASR